jgi:molecular chaperone DnaJ
MENNRLVSGCCCCCCLRPLRCLFLSSLRVCQQEDKSAESKFKEATEAYEVLSDDKQRELYNQYGHAGVDPNFSEGNPFQDGSFHFTSSSNGIELDPADLFDMFFGSSGGGRRRQSRGPRPGADLQMQVNLSFKEAVFGASKDLNLKYETVNRKTGETKTRNRTVTVDIPPGIDSGMNLRLQGKGAEGDPGAPPGNLLVQVIIEDDDYFIRDGYDVHTEVPISIAQAILGGTVDVKTLAGEVEMKIPKGCHPDTKLMLRGKGIRELNGSRKGNQVVHLKVVIPKKISPRQEDLLREFDSETAKHGLGISGRIAHAAESAFKKMFGKKTSKDDSQTDGDAVDKKQAAQ